MVAFSCSIDLHPLFDYGLSWLEIVLDSRHLHPRCYCLSILEADVTDLSKKQLEELRMWQLFNANQ